MISSDAALQPGTTSQTGQFGLFFELSQFWHGPGSYHAFCKPGPLRTMQIWS